LLFNVQLWIERRCSKDKLNESRPTQFYF
jgi:hypothetical protein